MTIHDSLQKILADRDTLATLFYQNLFQRHPEFRPYFKDVNMRHQAVLLTMSLMVIERHFNKELSSTALYLKYLGHKHHIQAIPEDAYPKWIDSLLETLGQFHGPAWDQEAAGLWRQALERGVRVMLEGYTEPVQV
jgi:hemoglobin-like flavoprotein